MLNARSVTNVGEAVRELTGEGVHVSLEALVVSATFENSLRSLRKLGRHVQVGMPVGADETVSLPLLDLIYARQLTVHGMQGLGAAGFRSLFEMVRSGRLDLGDLVTQRIPLSEAGNALRAMDGSQPAGVTVITNLSG